jgi:hypothetical protein
MAAAGGRGFCVLGGGEKEKCAAGVWRRVE